MNIFHRLGDWWERRRTVRKTELNAFISVINEQLRKVDANFAGLDLALKESAKVPTGTANELKAIRIRLDQLELFVGLKRDKKPQTIEGSARIG